MELLDAGEAPRRALLLQFEQGDTATVDLTLDTRVEQVDGDSPQTVDPPSIVQTVRFDVDEVQDGEAEISFEVLAARVDPADDSLAGDAEQQLDEALEPVIGLGGSGTVDDRGRFSRFSYELPPDLDPAVADVLLRSEQQVAGLAVPLPEEPVGTGARWRTTSAVSIDGFRTDQVVTYEITAILGDSIAYTATVEHSSPAQDLDRPGLPAGTTARVLAATARGRLSGTLHLGSVLSPSDLILTGQQMVELESSAGTETVTHNTDVVITVRPTD